MASYTGQAGEFTRQCEAKSKNSGGRCRKRAIQGSNVCGTHGGEAPQVKMAAKMRLALLVDPAIQTLKDVLQPGKGKYVKQELKVKVAQDVLDRNGFKAKEEVILTQKFDAERFNHMSEEEIATLVNLAKKASTAQDARDAAER